MNIKVKPIEDIANKHIFRINEALTALGDTFPISDESVKKFSNQEILTSRFAKLQDHLGENVIDLFFELNGEITDSLTMIDKLNKLEKIHIIKNAHIWIDMCKARNIIAHEYPDNPALIAKTLNDIYAYCPILIAIK